MFAHKGFKAVGWAKSSLARSGNSSMGGKTGEKSASGQFSILMVLALADLAIPSS